VGIDLLAVILPLRDVVRRADRHHASNPRHVDRLSRRGSHCRN
jgi:hypothetical protein